MVLILYSIFNSWFKVKYKVKKSFKTYYFSDLLSLFKKSFNRFLIEVSYLSNSDFTIKEDLEYIYILLALKVEEFEVKLRYIKAFL